MRPIHKWAMVLAITLSLLMAGVDAAASTESTIEGHPQRSVKKARAKKSSRKAVSRSRRGRTSAAAKGRRRGRYAKSRRRRPTSAPDAIASARSSAGIPTERATEIQSALIKLGYMDGPASGQYDDATVEAMKRFQSDNRLSATGLPSAHTLKRLGVAKRSNDGYAVPVNRSGQSDQQ